MQGKTFLDVQQFLPNVRVLLAWSTVFRATGTWQNYLGYVKTGCLICEASTEVFGNPALRRAKSTIAKSNMFVSRKPMFIKRDMVSDLVSLGAREPGFYKYSMLFLFTYWFLLRLPSEAVPARHGTGTHCLSRHGDELVLVLKRRKNKPLGSKLTRSCLCRANAGICPVHVLGAYLSTVEVGSPLFPG
eukprot:12427906-Karenia_brevis.AAC.1